MKLGFRADRNVDINQKTKKKQEARLKLGFRVDRNYDPVQAMELPLELPSFRICVQSKIKLKKSKKKCTIKVDRNYDPCAGN